MLRPNHRIHSFVQRLHSSKTKQSTEVFFFWSLGYKNSFVSSVLNFVLLCFLLQASSLQKVTILPVLIITTIYSYQKPYAGTKINEAIISHNKQLGNVTQNIYFLRNVFPIRNLVALTTK